MTTLREKARHGLQHGVWMHCKWELVVFPNGQTGAGRVLDSDDAATLRHFPVPPTDYDEMLAPILAKFDTIEYGFFEDEKQPQKTAPDTL